MNPELRLQALIDSVQPTDPAAEDRARKRLDSLTKPPGSLGRLEDLAAQVARIQDTDRPLVERKVIIVMAADHGVVAEGVSPYPQEVTVQMVANFAAGGAAVNQLAAAVGAQVRVVDVGVAGDVAAIPGVEHEKIAPGTQNLAAGPAMTREEAARAILVGARCAREAAGAGVRLIGTGEMGIGNTTASAALTAAFTGLPVAGLVGRGTGLDDAGLNRKVEVVERALRVNDVDRRDVLGTLAALGGLEIAALAGVVLGAAATRTAVIVDGFISGVAALVAVRLAPSAAGYILPSHRSAEPGHKAVLDALGLEPVIDFEMRLGEGTGAALVMGIVDGGCRMLSGMATFAEANVSEAPGRSAQR